jgi:hypothetical protein
MAAPFGSPSAIPIAFGLSPLHPTMALSLRFIIIPHKKADFPAFGRWWGHQLSDGREYDFKLRVAFPLKGIEFVGEVSVGGKDTPQPHKGSDHEDTGLHRPRAVQNISQHQGTMLGEGVRQMRRKLQAREVVTICDHLGFLGFGELEHEIRRKTAKVSLDLLVEPLGRDTIDRRKIRIQHDPFSAEQEDSTLDALGRNQGCLSVHGLPPARWSQFATTSSGVRLRNTPSPVYGAIR